MTARGEFYLPASKTRLQWDDARGGWGATAEQGRPDWLPAWTQWTGKSVVLHYSLTIEGSSEPVWVVIGELPDRFAKASITLPDSTKPLLRQAGLVWAAEWVGPPQIAHLHLGELVRPIDLRRRRMYALSAKDRHAGNSRTGMAPRSEISGS